MKPALVRLLCCPACGADLELNARVHAGSEVMEGQLACAGCGARYPVTRGVPRFVSRENADCFVRQSGRLRTLQLDSLSGTGESERTLGAVTGWGSAELADRLVLDVGAGAGRFAEVAAAKGAEVVGIESGDAVDVAFDNIGCRPGVHLVQADVTALPLRSQGFDLAYSIGALNTTPDPHTAFECIADKLRPGGLLALDLDAGVTAEPHGWKAIRRATTRLQPSILFELTRLAIPFYFLYRLPLLGRLFQRIAPISLHSSAGWRWLESFDWYRARHQWQFSYPEVYRWFAGAGYAKVELLDAPMRFRGVRDSAALAGAAPAPRRSGLQRAAPLRVVCLGGGTGLPVVLRGLHGMLALAQAPGTGQDSLTAVVTVADDGGSSGRLRRAYQILAPGDIRNCLLALSDADEALAPLFNFRFGGEGDVGGHSLGNLILTALSEVEGDFVRGVERAGEILATRGRVLPSTATDVTLVAELQDGTSISGESRIASAGSPVRRVWLRPENTAALPQVTSALASADLVVIGPGSVYTSLLPTLLVRGVADAIRASGARVVLVMNLMTEPGETDGLTAAGHLRVLREHVPGLPLHDVLVNRSSIPEERRRSYRSAGALPVLLDMDRECGPACRVVYADLLSAGSRVRHDPAKLGAALLDLAVAASQGLDVALAAPSAEQIAFQQTRVSVRNAVQAAVMPDRESVV